MTPEELENYKKELCQMGYLAQYWDGKKTDYACTRHGMNRLMVWMQINDQVKDIDFQADAPLITTEKKQYILTEFYVEKFVTTIFKNGKDEIVPTEKGAKFFDALLFLQDEDRKKRAAKVETAKKVGVGFMKGLVKFTIELQKMSVKMNQAQTPPKKVKKKSKKKNIQKKKNQTNELEFRTITSDDL